MPFSRMHGGRLPPHPNFVRPRLYIDDFLRPVTTPASGTIDYFSAVGSWPMDMNGPDPSNPPGIGPEGGIGDCGIAGMDHGQMLWNQYAHGTCQSWGNDTVLGLYEYLSGYVYGDPSTDKGTVLQDNLDHWRKEGVNGDKIAFFGALRPGSWLRAERVQALRAFGFLYLGLNLPESAEQQFPGPWTFVPGSPAAGGHCTIQAAEFQRVNEIKQVSWGAGVDSSAGFLLHTCEEAWVVGSPDFIEVNGRNPSGLDIEGINDALKSLTGETNPLGLRRIL